MLHLQVRSKRYPDGMIEVEIKTQSNNRDVIVHEVWPPYYANIKTTGVLDGIELTVTTVTPTDIMSPMVFHLQSGSELIIHRVPMTKPKLVESNETGICPFCFEPIAGPSLHPASCTHMAHPSCIKRWLARTCAVCRTAY